VSLERYRRNGDIEETAFGPQLTLLIGPRNSSKTTTLEMIDFCFGESDSAERALGTDVVSNYVGLRLNLSIRGQSHTIERALAQSFGPLTRIVIGENEQVDARSFSDWMMNELGWPRIEIPKGRQARLATETVPLTFRTLLRHIYRRENSWYEFASREEEYHRRAVTAFFLGLAESRYSNEDFRVGEAERNVRAVEAQLREVEDIASDIVARLGEELGLAGLRLDNIEVLNARLGEAEENVVSRRTEILRHLRASPRFVLEPTENYKDVSAELAKQSELENNLQAALEGYREALETNRGQLLRLDRLDDAIEVFGGMPVTLCPACQQLPPLSRPEAEAQGVCYVCGQAVSADVRRRRLELEKKALDREFEEISEILTRTREEVERVQQRQQELATELKSIGDRLDRERAELVAPFLSELEELSREAGALAQQRATLEGLGTLTGRRNQLAQELMRATEELEQAEAALRRAETVRRQGAERCATLADAMNGFLTDLGPEAWSFGRVTVVSEDFSFYVGTHPWEDVLGAESRVMFFLAYHYALLCVGRDVSIPRWGYSPGCALLDNPLQHGLRDVTVGRGLDQLVRATRGCDSQLIATLPRSVPMLEEAHVIHMPHSYGDEEVR
jgi:hypothetical protein